MRPFRKREARNRGRRFLLLAALVAAWPGISCEKKEEDEVVTVVHSPEGSPYLRGKNVEQYHLNASNENPNDCIGCHGDMTDETSLAPGTEAFHPRHALVTPQYVCIDCHPSVDLLERSGSALRKQSPPAMCAECHVPGAVGPALFTSQ